MLEEHIARLDERADAEGLHQKNGDPNRAELVRIMVAYAEQHMPAGWRPEGWKYVG